ncbi:MAG: Rab family GTPase [Candidatus Hodarchaeota archaeon]
MANEIIIGTIYSKLDLESGGNPVFWIPGEIEHEILEKVCNNSLNLYAGIAKEDPVPEKLSFLLFASLDLTGIAKMIRFVDEKTGNTCEATLSVVFDRNDDAVIYKYFDDFQRLFNYTGQKIFEFEKKGDSEGSVKEEIESFHEKMKEFIDVVRSSELQSAEKEEVKQEGVKRLNAKLVVCGAPAVGKTSLILRFTNNAFSRTYIPTLGVNLSQKVISYKNFQITFSIWDLAGQDRFLPFMQRYYKGSSAQIIVFDLTRPETYRGVYKWYKDIRKYLERPPIGMIIGNKSDLEEYRKVTPEEIQKLKDELGLKLFETSALTGNQVEDAFLEIGKTLVEQFEKDSEEYERQLSTGEE